MTAAIEALHALKHPCRVWLHTDSAYLEKAFNEGWIDSWIRKGWKTASKKPVENQDLWKVLIELDRVNDVEWIKVKGHADDETNIRVDGLAVEAMKMG